MLRRTSRGLSMPALDDQTLDELYEWLEPVPFSRRRRNMARDFADGVLVAELVAHFLPRYVGDLNAYRTANSVVMKKYNWETLNKMVFTYLNFNVSPEMVDKVINGQAGAIEYLLTNLRVKIDMALSNRQFKPNRARSRSQGRTDSNQSINEIGRDASETSSGSSHSCAHHLPKGTLSGAKEQLYQDVVPARQLHNSQQQLLVKEEQIQTLHARVRHLERLIGLKEERIAELMKRLDRATQLLYQQRPPPTPKKEQPTRAEILASMLASINVTVPPPAPAPTPTLMTTTGDSETLSSVAAAGSSTPSSPPSSSLRRRSEDEEDDEECRVSPDLPPPPSTADGVNGRLSCSP